MPAAINRVETMTKLHGVQPKNRGFLRVCDNGMLIGSSADPDAAWRVWNDYRTASGAAPTGGELPAHVCASMQGRILDR